MIPDLNCYVEQIDTNRYNDYKITDRFFVLTIHLKDEVI